MKRLLIFAVLLMTSVSLSAQNVPAKEEKDVTKFLGIPVDGTKSEMIAKLKENGFVSNVYESDVLEGEFNGTNVLIFVKTNNNKVFRIALIDKSLQSETDIRIRFNKLYYQFKNNSRYITIGDYTIPENENLSHQMLIHNKRYESVHYQGGMMKSVWFMIDEEYGKFRIFMFYDNEYNKANGEDL